MNMRNADALIESRRDHEAMTTNRPVKQRYIAPTVEECHAIQVKMFRNHEKQWDRAGELTWIGKQSGKVTMETGTRERRSSGPNRIVTVMYCSRRRAVESAEWRRLGRSVMSVER